VQGKILAKNAATKNRSGHRKKAARGFARASGMHRLKTQHAIEIQREANEVIGI
jgi:hypothetical protein